VIALAKFVYQNYFSMLLDAQVIEFNIIPLPLFLFIVHNTAFHSICSTDLLFYDDPWPA
jgi:hypothetical protein